MAGHSRAASTIPRSELLITGEGPPLWATIRFRLPAAGTVRCSWRTRYGCRAKRVLDDRNEWFGSPALIAPRHPDYALQDGKLLTENKGERTGARTRLSAGVVQRPSGGMVSK